MSINKIAILIKIAGIEFDKISNAILADYGLTASQYRVLKYLYSRPNETARVVDIERECSITHPTVLGLLDNLEKKEFIVKIVNPDDARSKVVSLAQKAKDMQVELEKVGCRLDDSLTENLSEQEKKQMLKLLQKLLKLEESDS